MIIECVPFYDNHLNNITWRHIFLSLPYFAQFNKKFNDNCTIILIQFSIALKRFILNAIREWTTFIFSIFFSSHLVHHETCIFFHCFSQNRLVNDWKRKKKCEKTNKQTKVQRVGNSARKDCKIAKISMK